jgi:hypothetical protein
MPKKIERVAGLNDCLDAIAGDCDLLPVGDVPAKTIRLNVDKAPNIILKGWTVYQFDGKPNREGRWLRLALHYSPAGIGAWVAEMTWCSDRDGETDLVRAREVGTVGDVLVAWDWSAFSKGAAKQLRWDVALRIGGDA